MNATLYIKSIKGKGRGVFAAVPIPAGALIEVCPIHVVPGIDTDLLNQTSLVDYFFHFRKEAGELAMVLGFGSLYNHATHPNACYEIDQKEKSMQVYAVLDIPAHTEICFNYSGEPGNDFSEWFKARGLLQQP